MDVIIAQTENLSDGVGKILKVEALQKLAEQVVDFLPNFLTSLLILLIFYILLRVVLKIAESTMESLNWEKAVQQLLVGVLKATIIAFAIITAAGQLGINVASLLAGLGVAGLAISFAAKDSLENLIAGVTILVDKPFRVGDLVEYDNSFGYVVNITLRTTRIRTIENYIVVVPNSKMVSSVITNRSLTTNTNVFFEVGIGYESDIDRARKIALETLDNDERVLNTPEPAVVVKDLGDSSVNLRVKFTVADPALEIPMRFEYIEKVKKAFTTQGINIPFPIRTVYLNKSE
ncbi:MAG: mechanosensitive ion channel family protein [Vulcanimicrobiota bacterium]